MAIFYEEGFDPKDLNTKVAEMLVATAEGGDELINSAVVETLVLLRERLKMDVVFVAQFLDGKRVFRYVETPEKRRVLKVGDCDPLEETWCQRVVEERMPPFIPNLQTFEGKEDLPKTPFEIATFLSTPIRLHSGQVYGTLCCFSFSLNEEVQRHDLMKLKSVAVLIAKKIERAQDWAETTDERVSFTLVPKSPSW